MFICCQGLHKTFLWDVTFDPLSFGLFFFFLTAFQKHGLQVVDTLGLLVVITFLCVGFFCNGIS